MGSVASWSKQGPGEERAAALGCSANGRSVGAGGATATSQREATKQSRGPFAARAV